MYQCLFLTHQNSKDNITHFTKEMHNKLIMKHQVSDQTKPTAGDTNFSSPSNNKGLNADRSQLPVTSWFSLFWHVSSQAFIIIPLSWWLTSLFSALTLPEFQIQIPLRLFFWGVFTSSQLIYQYLSR